MTGNQPLFQYELLRIIFWRIGFPILFEWNWNYCNSFLRLKLEALCKSKEPPNTSVIRETHCLKVLIRCILYLQLTFDKSCWIFIFFEKEGGSTTQFEYFKISKVVSIWNFQTNISKKNPKKLRTVVIHYNQAYLIYLITMVGNVDTQRGLVELLLPHSTLVDSIIRHGLWENCMWVVFMKVSFILYWQILLELVGRWQSLTMRWHLTHSWKMLYIGQRVSLVSAIQKWWSHFLLYAVCPWPYLTFSAFVYHTCQWYLALNIYEMMSSFLRFFFNPQYSPNSQELNSELLGHGQ